MNERILFVYVDTYGFTIWDKKEYILNNPAFDPYYDKRFLEEILEKPRNSKVEDMIYAIGNVSGEFIAQNIETEAKVVHVPINVDLLHEEVSSFRPTHVGFTVMLAGYQIFKECCTYLRKNHPEIVTIAGGVGALVPETKQIADYVCIGEGTSFVRSILKEEIDAPIKIPRTIIKRRRPSPLNPKKLVENPIACLTTNLGCGKGCDFCITYALYGRNYHIGNAQEIANALVDMAEIVGAEDLGVLITDPIGLANEGLWEQVIELLRGENHCFHISTMTTSSLARKYLQHGGLFDKFQHSEELEISLIELGLETTISEKYAKNKNANWRRLISDFSDRGIIPALSIIIGLEHHDRQNIFEDIMNAISLEPTILHATNLRVLYQTKLWHQYKRQGRLLKVPPEFRMLYGYQSFLHPKIEPRFKECLPILIECEELISENLGSFYGRALDVIKNRVPTPYNERLIQIGEAVNDRLRAQQSSNLIQSN